MNVAYNFMTGCHRCHKARVAGYTYSVMRTTFTVKSITCSHLYTVSLVWFLKFPSFNLFYFYFTYCTYLPILSYIVVSYARITILNNNKEPFQQLHSEPLLMWGCIRLGINDVRSINNWLRSWRSADGRPQRWPGTFFNDDAAQRLNGSTRRHGKLWHFRRPLKKEPIAVLCESSEIHTTARQHIAITKKLARTSTAAERTVMAKIKLHQVSDVQR